LSAYSSPPPFFYHHTAPSALYTLSLHDALPILFHHRISIQFHRDCPTFHTYHHIEPLVGFYYRFCKVAYTQQTACFCPPLHALRSEEHTSELQSRENLVCRLLLEKKKKK